jgi:hypothetical protein
MKTRILSGFIAASVLLTGAAWASVSVDYDLRVDFAHYKTYSWKQVQTVDPACDHRVKEAVEKQLAANGWTHVPSGGDVLLSATVVAPPSSTGADTALPSDPWGGFRRFGGGYGRMTFTGQQFPAGSLVIDMFDGDSRLLVLRAVTTTAIRSTSHKDLERLERDLNEMVEHFPRGSQVRFANESWQ